MSVNKTATEVAIEQNQREILLRTIAALEAERNRLKSELEEVKLRHKETVMVCEILQSDLDKERERAKGIEDLYAFCKKNDVELCYMTWPAIKKFVEGK